MNKDTVTFCLSTTGYYHYFWGIKYTTIVKLNEFEYKSQDTIIEEFKNYLNIISQQMPILHENIRHLNLHIDSHNNFNEILENAINNNELVYLCDHNH